MIILNSIYIVVFLSINILVLTKEKKIDSNILFDILSTNLLVLFRFIMYYLYKNINYTILFDFILIFIYEVYKKDLQNQASKNYLTVLEFINLLCIIMLFRYII